MPKVKITSNLHRFFPMLADENLHLAGQSVSDVIKNIELLAPGFSHYILDEHGQVRRHVVICIDEEFIIDRKKLSDKITEENTLYVFQALTGG
ncbi:MoaD/ThiS family protein [Catenovulum sp. SX2]|uniref:MoaD/ThiS family protein n=1 Tax=Catenovulum sp. SX2 TaxID=3398614 RepID=UPI003F82C49C